MTEPDVVMKEEEDDENTRPKRALSQDENEETPSKRRRTSVKTDSSEKKRQDKEEAKRQREEEKGRKRKEQEDLKEQKRREKEDAKRQREEEKEQKRKDQEEIKKQRDEEKERKLREQEESKEEKRKAQEELKKQRDEKKRQKEEERLERERTRKQKEEERKQRASRQSALFRSFFVEKKSEEKKTLGWSNKLFMPFEIKTSMEVAPSFHRAPLSKDSHDRLLTYQLETTDYLTSVRKMKRNRIRKDPSRAKYYHFHDNYRPPYYGTWRKVSKVVTARRPFALSHKELDYDLDSDAEWEEERAEEGEECLSEIDEGHKDESNDSGDDFCVEHGYLSENEGSEDGEVDEHEDSDRRKRRMHHRASEFNKQRSNKSRRLKKQLTTQCVGLTWRPLPPLANEVHDANPRMLKAVIFEFQ